jgi:hypothetical protein
MSTKLLSFIYSHVNYIDLKLRKWWSIYEALIKKRRQEFECDDKVDAAESL